MLRVYVVLALGGLLLGACRRTAPPSANSPCAIEGYVSPAGQMRISDVRISLRRTNAPGGTLVAATKTDLRGRFRIAGVPAGQYVLESDAAGQAAAVAFSLNAGETLHTVLRLHEPLRLAGEVVDRNGNPVPAALVLVWRSGQAANQADETETNEQGAFFFEQMAPGNVTLLVQAAGIGSVKWDPVALPSRRLRIALPGAGLTISGTVTGAKGPETQATVRLGGAAVRTSRSALTDAEGRFTFHGLGGGEYAVRAGTVIMASGTTKVTLGEGDVANVGLALGPGEVVTGTVIDGRRKALTGATVVLQTVPPDDCPEVLAVDVVGYFSTIAMARGTYEILARMPGFVAEPPKQVTINGRPAPLSIQMFLAGRVFGRVLTPSGKPAAGAEVRVTSPLGPRYPSDRVPVVAGNLPLAAEAAALGTQLLPHVLRARAVTVDDKGAFTLGELRPGSYGLSMHHDSGASLTVPPRDVKEGMGTDFGTLTLLTDLAVAPSMPAVAAGSRKLSGMVKDPKGRPLANASVAVSTTPDPAGEFVSSISGRNGEFAFADLPDAKPLVLNARHASYGTATATIGLTDKFMPIQFLNAGGIEGEVVDERGRFVQNVQVSLRASDGSPGPAVQMRGAGFRALGVPPGVWTLVVTIPSQAHPHTETVTVPPGTNVAIASLRRLRIKVATAGL